MNIMNEVQGYDVIIIGSGPGGVSASLYTVRAGMKTLIVGKDGGALEKSEFIDNYYGLENGSTGKDLIHAGIGQAKRLGVNIINDEVVNINYTDSFLIKTKYGKYKSSVVIFAVGSSRALPKIPGILEYEGKGVSYCSVCDGFFYRGQEVAVLGAGDFALNEATELSDVCSRVYVLTNGLSPATQFPPQVFINERPIAAIEGKDKVERVVFQDGTALDVAGVFVALGVAGSTEFAKSLGVAVEGRNIIVNDKMETNIPGLYAAGDCTGGMRQIANAVYQGARAGNEAVRYIRNIRNIT